MGSQVEQVALYALLRSQGVKWGSLRARLDDGDSPSEVLRDRLRAHLIQDEFDDAIADAGVELDSLEASGISVDTYLSKRYPQQLLTVHDYPPVVFWQGQQHESDLRAVAIVGTRKPSKGALRFAGELGTRLGHRQIPVVSGLARGVDTAAMRASLDVGNRTIGIIGTGVRHYYPSENRELQQAIARDHLLLSQFRPDTSGSVKTFPMRNAVMSAFASLTVIAEAGENSGTRIQARAAVRHGRPLIITRAVYQQTTWGRALVEEGRDVEVVGSAAEADAAIERIHKRYASAAWQHSDSLLAL